jgi:hypothetical protein
MHIYDITIQATLRPELLERTLSSHVKHLFGPCIEKARLIMNIDLVGCDSSVMDEKLNQIYHIIDKYPFHDFKINECREPNFAHAWFWCMEQLESDLFFNLEEDWEMTMDLDFKKMIDMMNKHPRLAHLRLSSFISTNVTCKNWNKFLGWNGEFFEVKSEDKCVIGWCGHPSLNKTVFMNECLPLMDRNANPEKQIKGRRFKHPMNDILDYWRFGSFHPQNAKKAVIDIGRAWMIEHGFAKKGNKAFFTEWERVKN